MSSRLLGGVVNPPHNAFCSNPGSTKYLQPFKGTIENGMENTGFYNPSELEPGTISLSFCSSGLYQESTMNNKFFFYIIEVEVEMLWFLMGILNMKALSVCDSLSLSITPRWEVSEY